MDQSNIRHKETQTAQAQGSIDSTVTCLYKKTTDEINEKKSIFEFRILGFKQPKIKSAAAAYYQKLSLRYKLEEKREVLFGKEKKVMVFFLKEKLQNTKIKGSYY